MRIVIAAPFYPPESGVLATYAAGIEGGLTAAGHTVHIVRFSRSLPPGIRHVVFFLKTLQALRAAEAILALDTWSVGFPAFCAARLMRVPFAVRIGGDFLWESYVVRTGESIRLSDFYNTPRSLSLKERAIRFCTERMLQSARVLFTTQFQEDIWTRAYTIPKNAISRVENYVSEKSFTAAEGMALVSAGRTIGLKNRGALETIVARLKEKYPTLELDTRLLSPAEHRDRLKSVYAVIIPSISEVCSNTAIDAVVAGKPFIMTEDTGTKERFGACGIFVDTRSEEKLQATIESILNPNVYATYRAAIESFSYTHSWDEIAREIVAAVQK